MASNEKGIPKGLELVAAALFNPEGLISAISAAAVAEAKEAAELKYVNPLPGKYSISAIKTRYTPEGRSGQLVRSGYEGEIIGDTANGEWVHAIACLREFVIEVNPDGEWRSPQLIVPEAEDGVRRIVLLAPQARNSRDGEIFVDGTPRRVRAGSSVKISKFHTQGIEQLLEGKVVTQYQR